MGVKRVTSKWVLFMMLMSMIAGAMCLNKVAPILLVLEQDMNLSASSGGLLISVFVFAGIFLSLPIGSINFKTWLF